VENHDWIRRNLHRQMLITAYGIDESREFEIRTDPDVLHAVESLPKARKLLEDAKEMIARRNASAQ